MEIVIIVLAGLGIAGLILASFLKNKAGKQQGNGKSRGGRVPEDTERIK